MEPRDLVWTTAEGRFAAGASLTASSFSCSISSFVRTKEAAEGGATEQPQPPLPLIPVPTRLTLVARELFLDGFGGYVVDRARCAT